jgi:tripartite-type tricarboxylate transporter receptor subunit TctC
MQHVPYRGSAPLVTDLLAGQVQSAFDNLPASIEHIRSGKLRALAVGTETRSDQLANIPTLGEFLPGFEASAFVAIGAPNNTPTEIIGRLNHEINAGLADPKIKARLAELGGTAFVGSPSDFSKLIAEETEKWARVIRAANIKPE